MGIRAVSSGLTDAIARLGQYETLCLYAAPPALAGSYEGDHPAILELTRSATESCLSRTRGGHIDGLGRRGSYFTHLVVGLPRNLDGAVAAGTFSADWHEHDDLPPDQHLLHEPLPRLFATDLNEERSTLEAASELLAAYLSRSPAGALIISADPDLVAVAIRVICDLLPQAMRQTMSFITFPRTKERPDRDVIGMIPELRPDFPLAQEDVVVRLQPIHPLTLAARSNRIVQDHADFARQFVLLPEAERAHRLRLLQAVESADQLVRVSRLIGDTAATNLDQLAREPNVAALLVGLFLDRGFMELTLDAIDANPGAPIGVAVAAALPHLDDATQAHVTAWAANRLFRAAQHNDERNVRYLQRVLAASPIAADVLADELTRDRANSEGTHQRFRREILQIVGGALPPAVALVAKQASQRWFYLTGADLVEFCSEQTNPMILRSRVDREAFGMDQRDVPRALFATPARESVLAAINDSPQEAAGFVRRMASEAPRTAAALLNLLGPTLPEYKAMRSHGLRAAPPPDVLKHLDAQWRGDRRMATDEARATQSQKRSGFFGIFRRGNRS